MILYLAPATVALLWWLLVWRRVPHWQDPRFIRHPERPLWSVWRFLNSREWTEEGLRIRRRHLIHLAVTTILAVFTALVLDLQ